MKEGDKLVCIKDYIALDFLNSPILLYAKGKIYTVDDILPEYTLIINDEFVPTRIGLTPEKNESFVRSYFCSIPKNKKISKKYNNIHEYFSDRKSKLEKLKRLVATNM